MVGVDLLDEVKSQKGRVTFERALKNENLTMLDFNEISIYKKSKIAFLEQEIIKTQAELDNYDKDYSSKAEWVVKYLQCSDFADSDNKMLSKVVEQIRIYKSSIETDFHKGIKKKPF